MFKTIPTSRYGLTYDFEGDGFSSATLAMRRRFFTRYAKLTIDDQRYDLNQNWFFGTGSMMHMDGKLIAVGSGKSPSGYSYDAKFGDNDYTIFPESGWKTKYEIYRNNKQPVIGTIFQESLLSVDLTIDLPDDIAIEFQFFITWLTLLSLEQDRSST